MASAKWLLIAKLTPRILLPVMTFPGAYLTLTRLNLLTGGQVPSHGSYLGPGISLFWESGWSVNL